MNVIDKTKLNEEQLKQLSEHYGGLIQTVELKLTLSFNNFGYLDQPAIPIERVAAGVADMMGRLWHIAATGSEKHLFNKEDHQPNCITQTDPMGAFKICDCGAYGEVGPPRDMWSMLSRFTKVEPITAKVETVEEVCPKCGNFKKVFGCFEHCSSPDAILYQNEKENN